MSAALARNSGLISRREALAAGMVPLDIQHMVRTRAWVIVRRGVYAEAATLHAAPSWIRQQYVDRAACLRISCDFVRSHDTAAFELGMPFLRPNPGMTHVTRPGVVGSHLVHGVKHHLAPYLPRDVVEANGFGVLGHARTAIDIAREHGHPYGVVAVDSARHLGTSLDDLLDVVDRMRNWPNRRRALTAVKLSDPGAESVGETLLRMLLLELDLGEIETQFELSDGIRTARFDVRIGRHLFEFDGDIKYRPESEGGIADRAIARVLREEKARQDWAVGFRLGLSRVGWSDVWGRGRDACRTRIAREFRSTEQAWGRSIDDLTPYLVRRPVA